jgi:rhodanese-related sulfurtransferase
MLARVTWALIGVAWLGAALADEPPAPAAPTATAAPPAAPAVPSISHADLLTRIRADRLLLLDVRTAEEYAAGHIESAVNIAHDQLASRSAELPADKSAEIIVYCRSGRRSAIALEWLRAQGYQRLLHVDGDWLGWQAAGQPVVTAASPKP